MSTEQVCTTKAVMINNNNNNTKQVDVAQESGRDTNKQQVSLPPPPAAKPTHHSAVHCDFNKILFVQNEEVDLSKVNKLGYVMKNPLCAEAKQLKDQHWDHVTSFGYNKRMNFCITLSKAFVNFVNWYEKVKSCFYKLESYRRTRGSPKYLDRGFTLNIYEVVNRVLKTGKEETVMFTPGWQHLDLVDFNFRGRNTSHITTGTDGSCMLVVNVPTAQHIKKFGLILGYDRRVGPLSVEDMLVELRILKTQIKNILLDIEIHYPLEYLPIEIISGADDVMDNDACVHM